MVAQVLGEAPSEGYFPWFKNKHAQKDFGAYYPIIHNIFHELNGDEKANIAKRPQPLNADAYFGGKWNFLFEYDEFQHFSTARLKTLEHYPSDLRLGFDIDHYKALCRLHAARADKYRNAKRTADFNFNGGRTAQRAYLDCFRDLLPLLHGLKPTLRITEFEVSEINANTEKFRAVLKEIIFQKLSRV